MAVAGSAHKSATFDEVAHLAAGYSYWTHDDYRLQPENGNWPQRLIGLPLVLSGYRFPSLDQPAWQVSDVWRIGDEFLYSNGNDADAMLLRGRMMVALAGALLGVLVFAWSRRLFGAEGAWVSLLLFVFNPSMLAHGALATSDLFAAAAFFAATWALWTLLHRVSARTLAVSVLATSGLFLAKFSAPILVVVAIVMAIVRLVSAQPVTLTWRGRTTVVQGRRARSALFGSLGLVHVVAGWAMIWASYGFRYDAMAAPLRATGDDRFRDSWAEVSSDPTTLNRLVLWGREHRALPEAYLYGISTVAAFGQNRVAFLNGDVRFGGSRWFFPYAALVKTTLPAMLLLVLALALLITGALRSATAGGSARWLRVRSGAYDVAPLLVLMLVYWAFAISSRLNIGHRHLLPTLPPAMVLAGGAGAALARRKTLATTSAVAALLVWHAGESIRIAPHYLAYFNELDGGPKEAYRHLVDSSLDWGQDLPALKEWLDREGLQAPSHQPVYLSYFGTARPEYYHIEAIPLPGFFDRWAPRHPQPLSGGVYCISATMLQGLYLDVSAGGAWTPEHEARYQATLYNMRVFVSTAHSVATRDALVHQTGSEFWLAAFHALEQLRFARLAATLRHREPDAQVGYSILIYRLSDADVERALLGPPP